MSNQQHEPDRHNDPDEIVDTDETVDTTVDATVETPDPEVDTSHPGVEDRPAALHDGEGDNRDDTVTGAASTDASPSDDERTGIRTAPQHRLPVSMPALVTGALLVWLGLAGFVVGTSNLNWGVGLAIGLLTAGLIVLGGILVGSRSAS